MVYTLTVQQAMDVATCAAMLGMTHEEFGKDAVRLLCRSMLPKRRGRPVWTKPANRKRPGRA